MQTKVGKLFFFEIKGYFMSLKIKVKGFRGILVNEYFEPSRLKKCMIFEE